MWLIGRHYELKISSRLVEEMSKDCARNEISSGRSASEDCDFYGRHAAVLFELLATFSVSMSSICLYSPLTLTTVSRICRSS